MKPRYLCSALFAGVFLFSFAAFCRGDAECSRGGCVRVVVRDELGKTVSGAAVALRLPGSDGKLMEGTDQVLTRVDGLKKGPAADGDGVAADGDVEFDLPALGQKLKPGTAVMLTVSAATQGLVAWSTTTALANGAVEVESANEYALSIEVRNTGGDGVTGFAFKAGGCEAVDGGANDADGAADGRVFAACPAVLAEDEKYSVFAAPGGVEIYAGRASLNPAAVVRLKAVVQ